MIEMISKKMLILQKLTEHLEGINPTNGSPVDPWAVIGGAQLDLSSSVYRGRTLFGDEVSTPFISLLEAPRQITPGSGGTAKLMQDEQWTILIQGFARDDKKHPLDPSYWLLAVVQERMSRLTAEPVHGGRGGLYPAEYRLGGLIGEIKYQIPVVRPGTDDVSPDAYFYMPIVIDVTTDLTKPFTQGD